MLRLRRMAALAAVVVVAVVASATSASPVHNSGAAAVEQPVATIESTTTTDVTPPTTAAPEPATTVPPAPPTIDAIGQNADASAPAERMASHSWRILLDFEPADLTFANFGILTATGDDIDQAGRIRLREVLEGLYAMWPVRVDFMLSGDPVGPNDVVIHFAGLGSEKQCGCGGVAYVTGATRDEKWRHGIVYRDGSSSSPISLAVTAAHEAGHMFGLNHPVVSDDSIMGVGNTIDSFLASWDPSDVTLLDQFFAEHQAV